MKKAIIIMVILAVVVIFGWYGFVKIRQRGSIPKSDTEQVALLINQEQGVYIYSDMIAQNELDDFFQVAGFVDELTPEEIDALTEGMALFEYQDYDDSSFDAQIEVPDASEVPAWTEAVDSLFEQQQQLCNSILQPRIAQDCQLRHFILNTVIQREDEAICDKIFIENVRQDCHYIVSNKLDNSFGDSDGDYLIDSYEYLVHPEEFEQES